jgi:hypothetical protein
MKVRELPDIRILFLTIFFLWCGCDDQESTETGVSAGPSEPGQSDLDQSSRIADAAQAGAIVPISGANSVPPGSGDLGVLGGDANQNQQAFRQRFGLADPTQDQLTQWDEYDARLTAYSNKDADWRVSLHVDYLALTKSNRLNQ